jgi:DNA-binding protein HU-beta
MGGLDGDRVGERCGARGIRHFTPRVREDVTTSRAPQSDINPTKGTRVNKRDLVAAIAAHTETDPKVVSKVIEGFVDVTLATVAKDEPVAISGFAKFAKVKRAARTGRNPQTGAPVKIKASTKPRISPLKNFKDVVMGAAPAPKIAKAPAKKMTLAKAVATKAVPPTKKTAAKKAAPAKKAVVKKAPAKKAAAKKR